MWTLPPTFPRNWYPPNVWSRDHWLNYHHFRCEKKVKSSRAVKCRQQSWSRVLEMAKSDEKFIAGVELGGTTCVAAISKRSVSYESYSSLRNCHNCTRRHAAIPVYLPQEETTGAGDFLVQRYRNCLVRSSRFKTWFENIRFHYDNTETRLGEGKCFGGIFSPWIWSRSPDRFRDGRECSRVGGSAFHHRSAARDICQCGLHHCWYWGGCWGCGQRSPDTRSNAPRGGTYGCTTHAWGWVLWLLCVETQLVRGRNGEFPCYSWQDRGG